MSRLHGDKLGMSTVDRPLRDGAVRPRGARGPLVPWTPAIVQLGSVTATVVTATYMQIERKVDFQFVLSVTGAGTAANVITVSLPVTANSSSTSSVIGFGYINDFSTGFAWHGEIVIATSTTLKYVSSASGAALAYAGAGLFAQGLAVTDVVTGYGWYEAVADLPW